MVPREAEGAGNAPPRPGIHSHGRDLRVTRNASQAYEPINRMRHDKAGTLCYQPLLLNDTINYGSVIVQRFVFHSPLLRLGKGSDLRIFSGVLMKSLKDY